MKLERNVLAMFSFGLLLFIPVGLFSQNSAIGPRDKIDVIKSATFVEGKTVIRSVSFAGLDAADDLFDENDFTLPESEVLRHLRESRQSIPDGSVFKREQINDTINCVKEWLTVRGYPKASVMALGESLPDNQMSLIFSIDRGQLITVKEIRFEGNEKIPSDEFLVDFRQCLGDRRPIFDQRLYEYYSEKCSRQLMFSQGYFEGKIVGISKRLINDKYIVTISVNEGKIQYRWGEITIEGAKALSTKEILDIAGFTSGDIADGKALQTLVYDRLRDVYLEMGYIQYNAEFDPIFVKPSADRADGLVNVEITIDEGRKYSVHRIVFKGADEGQEQSLRDAFILKEGDIFSSSKFTGSIAVINQLGWFQEVEKDRDVELLADDKAADVDIVLNLKPLSNE